MVNGWEETENHHLGLVGGADVSCSSPEGRGGRQLSARHRVPL